jgi:hypothetical protein
MKKTLVTFTMLVIVAALCIGLAGCFSINLGQGSVMGNGQMTTKEISLSNAPSGAKTMTSIDIVLDPSLEGKAVLEGESNILDVVTVQNVGGVLEVNYKPNMAIISTRPVKLRMPVISGGLLETNSSGSISMLGTDALKGDTFELRTNSSGNITLAIEAKQLKAVTTSSGNIKVTGSAQKGDIELSSSGTFSGFDCKMATANVRLSSSGNAEVSVSEELTGNTSSSGSVIYDGDPGKVNVSTSSSGKAVKR